MDSTRRRWSPERVAVLAAIAFGVAALIVDSFTGRGVRRTVADQTLVSAAQMEGDAFAALALLRADPRIDPARIGIMGVSKGGGAALSAAIAVRQRWRNGFAHLFDLHVAICPGATAQHRNPSLTIVVWSTAAPGNPEDTNASQVISQRIAGIIGKEPIDLG